MVTYLEFSIPRLNDKQEESGSRRRKWATGEKERSQGEEKRKEEKGRERNRREWKGRDYVRLVR